MRTALLTVALVVVALHFPGAPRTAFAEAKEAPAQDVVGAGLAAITGNALLDKADRMIREHLNDADQRANGLVNNLLTGLSALTQAARLNLGDELKKRIGDLEQLQRDFMSAIAEQMARVDAAVQSAYDLEESANMDVNRILDRFLPDRVYVSSARGLAVHSWEPRHSIRVMATHIGAPEAKWKYDVQFALQGEPIVPASTQCVERNICTFTFESAAFRRFMDTLQPRTADLTMTINWIHDRHFTVGDKKYRLDVHALLTVFPLHAGTATFSFNEPVFGWKNVGTRTEYFRTADCGNAGCDGGTTQMVSTTHLSHGNAANPPVGAQKAALSAIRCGEPSHDSDACRYIYRMRAVVHASERYVEAEWFVTGVWATMHVSYDVLEWSQMNTVARTVQRDLNYGEVVEVCLPPGVSYYTVSVETVTGRKLQSANSADVEDILDYQGSTDCELVPDGKRFVYKVRYPKS